MMKFEVATVSAEEDLAAYLCAKSEAGWELVSVLPAPRSRVERRGPGLVIDLSEPTSLLCIFRRQALGPRAGDDLRMSPEEAERAGLVLVSRGSHPSLTAALEIISHDCGAGAYEAYYVPGYWVPLLEQINRMLTLLTKEELETFCIGDEDEARYYERTYTYGAIARVFINAFFVEQWGVPA